MSDLIDRQAAIDCMNKVLMFRMKPELKDRVAKYLKSLPSAESEDWMERNKERILQAGMEGREIRFWIGGRLFAIREMAQ